MGENNTISGVERNVDKAERIISLAAGASFLYSALSGKQVFGKALAGGYLLYRGTTGYCPVYNALQINNNHQPGNITVKSYISINKPRREVYNFWRRFENLPLFMKHLESISVLNEKHAVWKAKIPGNLGTIDWKSEIVADVKDEYISWTSLPGSQIHNSGSVSFKDAGKFGTEVHIELSYHAPADVIGKAVGKLFNPILETMIREDLKNFRKYLETGEVPTYEGQSTGK